MPIPRSSALLCLAFFWTGCASRTVSYRRLADVQTDSVARAYLRADTGKAEEVAALSHVLSYLRREHPSRWPELAAGSRDASRTLESRVEDLFGRTLYGVVGGEMQFQERYPFDFAQPLDTFTVGFVQVRTANPLPPSEKEIVVRSIQAAQDALLETLGTDSLVLGRFQDGLRRSGCQGRIPVTFVTNPVAAKFFGIRLNYAFTTSGFTQTGPDSARFWVEVRSKYFGPVSLAPILHELVHAAFALVHASPSLAVIPSRGIQDLRRVADSLGRSSYDVVLDEGLAELLAHRHSRLYGSGQFDGADSTMDWLRRRYGRLHDLKSIASCYTGWFCSFDGRILSLYESRSFVGGLVDKYGMGKVLRLVADPRSWREGGSADGPSKQAEFAEWMGRHQPKAR